jgi:hypothetical protein
MAIQIPADRYWNQPPAANREWPVKWLYGQQMCSPAIAKSHPLSTEAIVQFVERSGDGAYRDAIIGGGMRTVRDADKSRGSRDLGPVVCESRLG